MSSTLEEVIKTSVGKVGSRTYMLGNKKISSFSKLCAELSSLNSLEKSDQEKCLKISKLRADHRSRKSFRSFIDKTIKKGGSVMYLPKVDEASARHIDYQYTRRAEKVTLTEQNGSVTIKENVSLEIEDQYDVEMEGITGLALRFEKRVKEEISDKDYHYLASPNFHFLSEKDIPRLLDLDEKHFAVSTMERIDKRLGIGPLKATKTQKRRYGETYVPYPSIRKYGHGVMTEIPGVFSWYSADIFKDFLTYQTLNRYDLLNLATEEDKSPQEYFKDYLDMLVSDPDIFREAPPASLREITWALLHDCASKIYQREAMSVYKRNIVFLTIPGSKKADFYLKRVLGKSHYFDYSLS